MPTPLLLSPPGFGPSYGPVQRPEVLNYQSRHAADIAVDISIEMALGPKQKVVAVAVNPSFIWTWDTSNIGLEG